MTRGHYYVTMIKDGTVERWAIPARHGTLRAIEMVKALCPDWTYQTITWRSRFEYADQPSNLQSSYSQTNTEQVRTPLFHPPSASAAAHSFQGDKRTAPTASASDRYVTGQDTDGSRSGSESSVGTDGNAHGSTPTLAAAPSPAS